MAADWPEVSVDEIKDSSPNALATGPFGSSISWRFFEAVGVPVIRGSNLSDAVGKRLVLDDLVFVSHEKAKEFQRSIARPGDLIFTCWGTIGQVGLINDRSPFGEYVVSNKQMKLTPNPEKADGLFLYYLFSGPEVSGLIKGLAIGSSVPGFNLGQLRSLRFHLPPLHEQKIIAHILGTLDDRIELNQRMNQTLEAMARAIFKSWFVDFDPVRARAEGRQPFGMDARTAALFPNSFQDSPLGKIPRGWRVGSLGEVAENPRRGVRPREVSAGTPYVGLEHMPRKSVALDSWGHAQEVASNKFEFRQGEILFGKLRPYFHKVGIAVQDGVCSTDILVIRAKSLEWFGIVLGHVSSGEFVNHTDAASTGTKMPRTNWQDMASYEIPLADPPLAHAFSQFSLRIVGMIRQNILQSRTLATIRDTLLPRLTSGEIRVRDAENVEPRVMA